MTVVRTISRVQMRILARDPWFLVIMFGMPLAVMPLFSRTMGLALNASGFPDATGAEVVVPGQTVLFGFFVASSAAFSIFREHGWRTWDRLRASAAAPHLLLAGYALPWIVIHLLYQTALFVAGVVFLDLSFNDGSPFATLLVMFAFSCCLISMMLLATASFRTINQVQALANLGAMVMGGLGGALVPLESLPGWAQTIAPITPSYWAMRGHRSVLLESGGVSEVLLPVAVLLGVSVVFSAFASVRFRSDETKEFFA